MRLYYGSEGDVFASVRQQGFQYEISIPNNTQLMCISWNQADNYIACGGDQGLLKVVKLNSHLKSHSKATSASSDVSIDINLEGHSGQHNAVGELRRITLNAVSGSVLVAVWNTKFQKLTTVDSRGYIIVWVPHNGTWYEEMINNRNKSTVNSMKWSSDGSKICIAYNDGMVIVGSVDGNKLWVSELHQNIVAVEWSPYDKLILLGTTSGEIYVYDSSGNFQSKIKVPVALNQLENQQLVCIDWGNSTHDFEGPSYPRCLAIVYQQGYLQLLFNEKDKHPLTANLPIQVIVAKWNPDGTVLAVLAEKAELPSGERSMIYFINGYGEPIHMLKIPAMQARGCSWEKSGLCLAIAADSSIILANIKAEYKTDQDSLAVSEKNKLIIFKGTEAQEPVFINARICELGTVSLRAIHLDDLIQDEEPVKNNYFADIPTKTLSDAIDLVKSNDIKSLQRYVEENQDPALRRRIAEEALRRMDVELAELLFVQLTDYNGIQFLRTLISLTDPLLKKAEIYAYLGEIDQAEKQLIESGRIDLAIALHRKCRNWKKVLQLMKDNLGITSDVRLDQVYIELGDHCAELRQWEQAANFYKQAKCSEKLITSYQMLEEYQPMLDLVDSLTDVDQMEEIVTTLTNAGLSSEAQEIIKKCRENKVFTEEQAARWKQMGLFVESSQTTVKDSQNFVQDEILPASTQDLTQILDVIQLHRKNKRLDHAAKMLFQMAKRDDVQNAGPLLLKYIHVLGALLVEMHKDRQYKDSSSSESVTRLTSTRPKTLNDLLLDQSDHANFYATDNPWRGAQAYHYYILSQRILYQGDAATAMKIALLLRDYEDKINAEEIYSLLALTSCNCGYFSICSKAFVKLEIMYNNRYDAEDNPYETLAYSVFTQNGIKDPADSGYLCPGCKGTIASYLTRCPNCDRSFPVCLVTGKTITDQQSMWTCKTCRHNADSTAMLGQNVCPLCHAMIE
ncbi:WD repeat containing protein 35 [Trichuris trichiura]|uniref:WD repeat containing protein 35 n=1 Tax=Trichuris trichiura TaxID=36087 RepID=A0A077ZAF7_TRITR|nr:WD repeat containing protein 35 [Trichuris trichiura]